VPAAAQADTYCVNMTGCDHDDGNTSLQQALDDAKNDHAGPDTVKVGAAPITTPTGFTYVSADPVAIEGRGGRDAGQGLSSISDSSTNPSNH
jgi:hypothetical protein